jgi:hypothetical protein
VNQKRVYTVSKFADQLRTIRVFNNYELLARFGRRSDFAVEYVPDSWGGHPRGTCVSSPRPHAGLEKTSSLSAAWERVFVGKRANTFEAAVRWATGISGDYAPSPFGGRVPRRVLDKARAAVKTKF